MIKCERVFLQSGNGEYWHSASVYRSPEEASLKWRLLRNGLCIPSLGKQKAIDA